VASFTGFVPAHDPEVVITVTMDEPRVEHAGGSVAAPVFQRVAEMVLRYRGVLPKGTEPEDLKVLAHRADPARAVQAILAQAHGDVPQIQEIVERGEVGKDQLRLPNLTGSPMRTVVKHLTENGVVPVLNGSGLLATQSPPPGTVVSKGTSVDLVFRPAS
jgi:cell division protein FtsI (penicillin-binding protein 3)